MSSKKIIIFVAGPYSAIPFFHRVRTPYKDEIQAMIKGDVGVADIFCYPDNDNFLAYCEFYSYEDANIIYSSIISKEGILVHAFHDPQDTDELHMFACNCSGGTGPTQETLSDLLNKDAKNVTKNHSLTKSTLLKQFQPQRGLGVIYIPGVHSSLSTSADSWAVIFTNLPLGMGHTAVLGLIPSTRVIQFKLPPPTPPSPGLLKVIVLFASFQDAQHVVDELNGTKHKGQVISVQHGINPAIGQYQSPSIGDGSFGPWNETVQGRLSMAPEGQAKGKAPLNPNRQGPATIVDGSFYQIEGNAPALHPTLAQPQAPPYQHVQQFEPSRQNQIPRGPIPRMQPLAQSTLARGIFIGNLPYDVTDDDLWQLITTTQGAGRPHNYPNMVIKYENGISTGTAIVTLTTHAQAQLCVDKLHLFDIRDHKILVRLDY